MAYNAPLRARKVREHGLHTRRSSKRERGRIKQSSVHRSIDDCESCLKENTQFVVERKKLLRDRPRIDSFAATGKGHFTVDERGHQPCPVMLLRLSKSCTRGDIWRETKCRFLAIPSVLRQAGEAGERRRMLPLLYRCNATQVSMGVHGRF